MKKNVCESCGKGWDSHAIETAGGNLLWICPDLERSE